MDVPKYSVIVTWNTRMLRPVYKCSEVKMKRSEKKKNLMKGWFILFHLLLCLLNSFNHSTMTGGSPGVWLFSILMLFQRALGVLLGDEM